MSKREWHCWKVEDDAEPDRQPDLTFWADDPCEYIEARLVGDCEMYALLEREGVNYVVREVLPCGGYDRSRRIHADGWAEFHVHVEEQS